MPRTRGTANARKRVVIGESMKRLKAAANVVGARWYQGWRVDPWDEGLVMQRNAAWIRQKVKQGYEIIDIGIDPTRNRRSTFYEMEKRIIKEANYPTTPFYRIQAGTRRK
jgi:hypothetical protein